MSLAFRRSPLAFAGAALFATVGTAAIVTSARAADRASPHDTVSATVGGTKVTISYGRPYKKGRAIFGGLVPYGEVWRTGADEATTLTVDGELHVGSVKLGKGTYTVFTIPGKQDWTIAVNSVAKQWGAYSYDAKKDVGRAPMKVTTLAKPVEQLTVEVRPAAAGKATLAVAWDTIEATVGLEAPAAK